MTWVVRTSTQYFYAVLRRIKYSRRLQRMCGSTRSKKSMPMTSGTTVWSTTKAIRADHEPICTVVRTNISHIVAETLASLTFRTCLRWGV